MDAGERQILSTSGGMATAQYFQIKIDDLLFSLALGHVGLVLLGVAGHAVVQMYLDSAPSATCS